ncbi:MULTISPECIES: hypothetical protein [unclassified Arthrobacter]|uniref:hypothetical protein n=1 Tax=unclassified Arthrobacter TaxID=235627 RepID=UPI001D15D9B9|nr:MULTISPECIES: hypothetical protein [unclassified Arthrobacter]MCC3276996.1 hypothetical protein [Arthrobacter sp. zg-Y20]MCC9178932.1 hypothetical protein [Arthrobacter sp. zg-Y750]MDK1317157.1 hypothetical protein [Arthrobacter sp. zg.Y20]WIB07255.1 hypothetical protein QNO06_05890 [Arthrobacter sp. zg-Y20]
MQQRPLYIRVRSILTILSTLWLIAAVIGLGFFSGGTTSLAFSLILLYTTGGALLVVVSAIYRFVTRAARQRVETVPEDNAAAVFVDTTRSATEEIMAALRPAAPAGRPAVRMPQNVDALDVAAALAARTAALTAAAVAEKSAVAAAAMVAPAKTATKSAVNKSATKKKSGPKQPAQPQKAQAGKSRPAASRAAGSPANTAPKKTTGGKKSGSAGKGAGSGAAAGNAKASAAPSPVKGGATGSAGTAAGKAPLMNVPGIRTAQQDVLPRLSGAPACGLTAAPDRAATVARLRELVSAA